MKFSVLVCAYNREDTVATAIDSVLSMARPDVELVVYDDASTDGTLRLLEGYGDRIRLFRNETNVGHARTWGRAIESARGEFLVKLDADDWLLPGYFEAVEAAIDDSIGMVIPSVYDFVEGTGIGMPRLVTASDIKLDPTAFRQKLLGRIFFRTPGMALRRSLTLDRQPPDQRVWQDDWEYLLRATKGGGAALLATPLAVYRIHEGSISGQGRRRDRLRGSIEAFAQLVRDPKGEAFLEPAERKRFMRGLAELYLRTVGSGLSLRDIGAVVQHVGYACRLAGSESALNVPPVAAFPLLAVVTRAMDRPQRQRAASPIADLLPGAS